MENVTRIVSIVTKSFPGGIDPDQENATSMPTQENCLVKKKVQTQWVIKQTI